MAIDIIRIKPISLSRQRVVEFERCELTLNQEHALYVIQFLAEEPANDEDEMLCWNERMIKDMCAFRKSSVAAIDLHYNSGEEKHTIYISINGMAEDIKLWFENEEEAKGVFTKIGNWVFG